MPEIIICLLTLAYVYGRLHKTNIPAHLRRDAEKIVPPDAGWHGRKTIV